MNARLDLLSVESYEAGVIPEELRNSAEKIINYAGIPKSQADILMVHLKDFRSFKDRSLFDPRTRKVRESIIPIFFNIYSSVLKRVLQEKNSSRLYQMFLIYGYMDENLLKPEQVNELYELLDEPAFYRKNPVYNAKDWLTAIRNMEKDPSINELGQDYYEVLREKNKRGEIKDKSAYENNVDERLKHEVDNLLKIGQKLCFGQIGGYFPILHSGMVSKSFSDTLVSPQKIEDSLNRILKVDYSALHREIVYNQPEKGIKKELIMKSVCPDFILMPTFGSRASVWQELAGRVRHSPGRFIFPVFTTENLDDLMIEVIPKFRWELSKSMFSYARNEVGQNSLVGDYTNYIQFYKKNRELSEEAKGKIRLQIEKCRNNIGDLFSADYNTWINYEAKGLLRLNKVARNILFKHCPFAKPIRDNLERHPIYNQLITSFNNLQIKDAKVLEAHYAKMVLPGNHLDQELMLNLQFHKM
ncbi:MAG: hypothetical protein ABFD08_11455 [Syntrophomonas sp.]